MSDRQSGCDLRFGRFVVGILAAGPDRATLRNVSILDPEGAGLDQARSQTMEFAIAAQLLAVLFEPDSRPQETTVLWQALMEGPSSGVRHARLRGTRFSFYPVQGLGRMITVEPAAGDSGPAEASDVPENAWK